MKRIVAFVLCAVMLLSLLPCASASVVGGGFVYEVYDDSVEIVGYDSDEMSVIIPETIEGKPVTKIGYMAFANSYIREITIPASVTYIAAGAFRDCLFLEKVSIPEGIEKIEFATFRGCTLLREVCIPESVTFIDDEAFYACSSLKTMSALSAGLTHIGESAFLDCHSLEAIEVSSGNAVYSSVDGVVYTDGGTTLKIYPAGKKDKTFEIPETVSVIAEDAFEFSQLEEIYIPATVKAVELNSFHHCPSLKKVEFADSDIAVGDCAFLECTELKTVIVPSDKIVLGDNVFDMCENVTVYAPDDSQALEYAKDAGHFIGYVDENGKLDRPFQIPKIDWGRYITIFVVAVVVVGGFILFRKFGKDKKQNITRE